MSNKIVYFDKETICNMLEEQEHGKVSKSTETEKGSSSSGMLTLDFDTSIKLDVPFFARLKFAFSGKIDAKYWSNSSSKTTVTSTEISEFERIKNDLTKFEMVKLSDVENSSTMFKTAGSLMRLIKGGVDDIDVVEFNSVMDGFNGYDLYKIDEDTYFRFNNTAFISNYKRDDILTSILLVYSIKIGEFPAEEFDYVEHITKMNHFFKLNNTDSDTDTLSSHYGEFQLNHICDNDEKLEKYNRKTINLYDAVYAAIEIERVKDNV